MSQTKVPLSTPYRGSTAPLIYHSRISFQSVVSFTLRPIYPWTKKPWYPHNIRPWGGGVQVGLKVWRRELLSQPGIEQPAAYHYTDCAAAVVTYTRNYGL